MKFTRFSQKINLDSLPFYSHRPVDVHNVYNQVQVKMLMKEVDCDNIPAFDDVFRDDEDETFQVQSHCIVY